MSTTNKAPGAWGLGALMLAVVLAAMAGARDPAKAQATSPEFVVATKEAPPFAMKAADGQWTGVAIDLWSRVADKLGLHTTFREYKNVPDMLGAVADGEANVAIAAITVTADREKTVDFTQPYL